MEMRDRWTHPAGGRRAGKLHIFLGYAAGVGKTHAMLAAGRRALVQGKRTAIAAMSPRDRAQFASVIREVDPRFADIRVVASGQHEIDLDDLLARKLDLVLIDGLAHDNPAGSRHPHRYQDVDELLAAGLDVYATLNICELSSLQDLVAEITGETVAEIVPDRVFDEASAVTLLDLPPEELMARIHGRDLISIPVLGVPALADLRELALRRMASRIEHRSRKSPPGLAGGSTPPVSDRLLVSVSPSPYAEKLVRAAHRQATKLHAEWHAVYVEASEPRNLSPEAQERIWSVLQLAESLGATTATLAGPSVADALVDYAQSQRVSCILIGGSLRAPWRRWLGRTIVSELLRKSGPLDVLILSHTDALWQPASRHARPEATAWLHYGAGIALAGLATLLGLPLRGSFAPSALITPYLLALVVAAVGLGLGAATLTAVFSVLAFDFFFIPPYYHLGLSDIDNLLPLVGFLVIGGVISTLVRRARLQAAAARQRETQTQALSALSRDLAGAAELPAVLDAVLRHGRALLNGEVALLMPDERGRLRPRGDPEIPALDDQEMEAACWALQHHAQAGRDTGTLPQARFRYAPLPTASGTVGVIGLRPSAGSDHLSPEQNRLLEVIADQAGLAVERVQFGARAAETEALRATERLQSALLNSVSHDLRTPLASVTGVLSTLRDELDLLDPAAREELLATACEEADRLNQLVGNLLDISRIEADALHLSLDLCDLQDLVGSVLASVGRRFGDRPVRLHLPPGLPLVPLDFVLISQVLINLLENANKYSPPDEPIEIDARIEGAELTIAVSDRGTGIPASELEHVFDKFYRGRRRPGVTGTGLGLAISRGIAEAHGGRIWAENRPDGGARFVLSLPIPDRADSAASCSTADRS
jgi:two-component system sensor histidine kinase KdpD